MYKPTDILMMLPCSKRLEVVYKQHGKISVMVVSFNSQGEMHKARDLALAQGRRAEQAYTSIRIGRGKVGF